MSSGAPLTDAMRNRLLLIAREMVSGARRKQSFKDRDFEGQVRTAGEQACMGTISGVYFTAVIESERISTRATFIVPSAELNDINQVRWFRLFPQWDDRPSVN